MGASAAMVHPITTKTTASASFRIRRLPYSAASLTTSPRSPRPTPRRLLLRGAAEDPADSPEGIERRMGEQVGGRLHEGEGDEHDAVRYAVVPAGRELDRAAAGRHPPPVAPP